MSKFHFGDTVRIVKLPKQLREVPKKFQEPILGLEREVTLVIPGSSVDTYQYILKGLIINYPEGCLELVKEAEYKDRMTMVDEKTGGYLVARIPCLKNLENLWNYALKELTYNNFSCDRPLRWKTKISEFQFNILGAAARLQVFPELTCDFATHGVLLRGESYTLSTLSDYFGISINSAKVLFGSTAQSREALGLGDLDLTDPHSKTISLEDRVNHLRDLLGYLVGSETTVLQRYYRSIPEEKPALKEEPPEPKYNVEDVYQHLSLLVKDINESGVEATLKKRVSYECGAQTQDIETTLGPVEEIEFTITVRLS